MKWLIAVLILAGVAVLAVREPETEQKSETAVATTSQAVEEIEEISISVIPEILEQGDPALIIVSGTTTAKSLKLDSKELKTFVHAGKLSALIGIDLRGKFGTFPLALELTDGRRLESKLAVGERYIARAPLGIPEELGGNTPEAERELINTLIEEGRLISAVPTSNTKLWEGEFRLPIDPPITITDTYGYSRITGSSNISHKGTDFRAAVGTPVYAMNSGRIVFTRFLRNYGNTIIIDHGLGLHTIYMHLSEINTPLNKEVRRGELIGKSGDTGYVLGPHLHLTIRINGTSIDPEKFMELMGNPVLESAA